MSENHSVFYLILLLSICNCVSSVIIRSSKLESFDSCGGEFSGYQYSITSPDYPGNYSEYQNCIYILRGSHLANCNQVFHFQFTNFSLRTSHNCELDYLIVDDKSVFCGDVLGIRTYPSKNNTLTLRFHSGKGGSNKGFKILVTTLPCPASTEAAKTIGNDNNQQLEKVYPIYRPDSHFISKDVQSSGKKIFESRINFNNSVNRFKDNSNLFLDDLKPPIQMNNQTVTKISTYLFAPPEMVENNGKNEISTLKNRISNTQTSKDPSLTLSNKENVNISNRIHQNLVVPERTYGVPAGKPYAPLPGYNPQIQTGEVFDNAINDYNGKPNVDVFENNYRDVPGSGNLYPAITYGAPGSPYPPSPPVLLNPSAPPLLPPSPPTQQHPIVPAVPRQPIQPPTNFIPSDIFNSFPRQCCNTQYSAPRFLISSPGFPNLWSTGNINLCQCIYTINLLPSVRRLRFYFKYFNYGAEDVYCRNGYLQIDGRRYCGCKTGFSVVSNVLNSAPKIIEIKYTGFPQTKLSGFLIEVIQETCLNNNYPYLSRKKKDVGNVTFDLSDESKTNSSYVMEQSSNLTIRSKRQAGYSYPKPNVDFNAELILPGNIGSGLISPTSCQTFNFLSWTHASKEVYLKGGRCNSNIGNEGVLPNIPNYPPGILNPTYRPRCPPGVVNPGNLVPGPSGNPPCLTPGRVIPRCPGAGNPNIRCFPLISGIPINPNFPVIPGNPGITNSGNPPILNIPGLPGPGYPGGGNGISPLNGCQYIRIREGVIYSPNYPNFYPTNVNICFRFIRTPDTYRLQLLFSDFDVENSQGCVKDYLLFINQNTKYCGKSIAGSKTLLEFPKNNIIDLQFVSDAFGTGRGFNIAFIQT